MGTSIKIVRVSENIFDNKKGFKVEFRDSDKKVFIEGTTQKYYKLSDCIKEIRRRHAIAKKRTAEIEKAFKKYL